MLQEEREAIKRLGGLMADINGAISALGWALKDNISRLDHLDLEEEVTQLFLAGAAYEGVRPLNDNYRRAMKKVGFTFKALQEEGLGTDCLSCDGIGTRLHWHLDKFKGVNEECARCKGTGKVPAYKYEISYKGKVL